MEQKVKEIVAEYIKIPIEEISESTIIDRSKVSSSIVLHRLYAKLAEEGYKVDNYSNITTLGNLLQQNKISSVSNVISKDIYAGNQNYKLSNLNSNEVMGIGIDIEHISAMPIVNDFREDAFYKMNFSAAEISYCILQSNPYASFAGLFAAKEAIVKANNSYKSQPFNTIVIEHLEDGKPFHNHYQLSISHTNDLAICVAVLSIGKSNETNIPTPSPAFVKSNNIAIWLALISILISSIAIYLSLK